MAREQILAQVKQNQPAQRPLPVVDVLVEDKNWVDELTAKLEILHVAVFKVASYEGIATILQNESLKNFPGPVERINKPRAGHSCHPSIVRPFYV